MKPFVEHEKLLRCSNAVAAGQATTNCTIVDTAGFDSVTFICAMGAIVATGTITMKIQQDTDSAGGTMADLAGATVAADSDDDNRLLVIEIYRPRERYVRAVITTAVANGTIDGVFCILRDPQKIPVTQSATYVASTATIVSEPAQS